MIRHPYETLSIRLAQRRGRMRSLPDAARPTIARALLWLALPLLLAGCAGTSSQHKGPYEPEDFDSTTTHSRSFPVSEAEACEAARRALLSQGYQISTAGVDSVNGRKSFQPEPETHLEVDFRVVCAREHPGPAPGPHSAIVFVTAVQDRFGLKKVNNSASVGVGVLGSLSLPFSSSDDAMVKIASQTLTDEHFYERFYELMGRFLNDSIKQGAEGTAPSATSAKGDPAPVITSPVLRQPMSEATPLPDAQPLVLPAAPVGAPDAASPPGASASGASPGSSTTPSTSGPSLTSPADDAANISAPQIGRSAPAQASPSASPPDGNPRQEPQPGKLQPHPHVMFST